LQKLCARGAWVVGKSISNILPGMTIQFSKWASCHN